MRDLGKFVLESKRGGREIVSGERLLIKYILKSFILYWKVKGVWRYMYDAYLEVFEKSCLFKRSLFQAAFGSCSFAHGSCFTNYVNESTEVREVLSQPDT